MKLILVQILVVVANTQVRTLRAKVGKGFVTIEISHELVDPKVLVNSTEHETSVLYSSSQLREGENLFFFFLFW